MLSLKNLGNFDIDWDLTPEEAVTMYLEWGNNDWHGTRPPVRSKSDESVYFVVDAWQDPPIIRLVRRNSENAVDILAIPLPEHLLPAWRAEHGSLKGVYAPTEDVKDWLRKQMEVSA